MVLWCCAGAVAEDAAGAALAADAICVAASLSVHVLIVAVACNFKKRNGI